ADMSRWVIEHPNWIRKDLVKRVDVRAGADKGRIYRIYPSDKKPRPIPHLDKLDTAGLVAAFDSPNGWQRDTAQRLLVQRKDEAAIPLLEKEASESKRAVCRLHALCTLDGLGALRPDTLIDALSDPHPGVRKHAVRLSEAHLPRPSKLDSFLAMSAGDGDAQVRLQIAYTLGSSRDANIRYALADLMLDDAPLIRAAAVSSLTKKNVDNVATALFDETSPDPLPAPLVEQVLRSATGFATDQATAAILKQVAAADAAKHSAWQFAVLAGWLDALDQSNQSLPKLAERHPALTAAVRSLNPVFERARATVGNRKSPSEEKLLAIRLLGRGLTGQEKDLTTLTELLTPQTPSDLQAAAVNSLGHFRGEKVPDTLLRGWKGYGPALRTQVLDVLSRREEWLSAVFQALERKQILPMEIDTPRRQRFLEHKSDKVRLRAAKLFADLVSPDRQKVVESYKSALLLNGDISRGKQVFTKTCSACHRVAGIGQQVGPDLAMTRDKEPDWFLTAIFDPNQAVDAKYVNYQAVTKNGLTFTGVLTNESGNSITLVSAEG